MQMMYHSSKNISTDAICYWTFWKIV